MNKIGYLSLYETEITDSFVGTFLVTNEYGLPLEFKCTHAIKPTAIQKALYGDQLKPFISINLCGIPLLNSLQNKPDLIITNHNFILAIRLSINTPTIYIRHAGETLNISSADEETPKERIESEVKDFKPIIIACHPDYKNENQQVKQIANQIFANFDIIEPFERMQKSVEILGRNDAKFK
jgi:hypothetical protein